MKQLPPEILVTARFDVLALVREHCPKCPEVFVPVGSGEEHDIYRCNAASGKHCIVAINTRHCIRHRLSEQDEKPA